MRATRVKKYRTRPPRRPCNAKKAKKQFSECWCREVFVFVAAVAVRCHAICTTVGKDYMTRNASRTNRVKQISTCWCRESLGSEICDVWFECGRQESKNIGQGRQEDRAMRRKQKKQFSECWCREVFVFVAAVAVRCHAICTTVGKDYMTRNASRTNRVKQISTCWCRESLGSEICDVWFECGRQESKNIGQGRQEDRAMRRKQKQTIFRMLV